MPNSKHDHKWPKVKADQMHDGYLINTLNYDPQIVKIREGDCALLRAHFLNKFLKDLEEENSKFQSQRYRGTSVYLQ